MGEFSVYLRLRADGNGLTETAEELVSPYVESSEAVTYGDEDLGRTASGGTVVPDVSLDVGSVEALADVYTGLRDEPDVEEVILWGPGSGRFPVKVYHHALHQMPQPDRYEFHAVDGEITLVIAESEREAEQLRSELPAGAFA